jgi:putative restriction endonuclease
MTTNNKTFFPEVDMSTRKAWSLLTVGSGQLQYGGNEGYEDELSKCYRYDNDVANSRRLSVGDLVFLRNKQEVLGAACIEKINHKEKSSKTRQRCPTCRATGIKQRKKSSDWRCHKCRSEFVEPLTETVEVVAFEALYENTFVPLSKTFPLFLLKAAILRPSDQMSIAEVNSSAMENVLRTAHLGMGTLVEWFVSSHSLAPEDAAGGGERSKSKTGSSCDTYIPSILDTRKAVLRNILARRGQKQFRDGLINRYGAACMVSGCIFP